MNFNRPVYGKITIGSHKIDLGRAPTMMEMMKRLLEQAKSAKITEDQIMIIEFAYQILPKNLTLSREALLEQELQSMMLTDLTEEVYPGVTLARVHEVMETEIFTQYYEICQPDKRIGIDDSSINKIKQTYELEFPDCVDHFPLWVK